MSSTIGRGEFTAGGDSKGFDYSLLLEEGEEAELSVSSPSPEPEERQPEAPLAPPTVEDDDAASWNTFHKAQHSGGHHQPRKDSTGRSPRHSYSFSSQQPPLRRPAGRSSSSSSQSFSVGHHGERTPILLSPETTVELYNFPAVFRTHDLKKVLEGLDGKYRIKWNNDTSCWAVFNNSTDMEAALAISNEQVMIRRYDPLAAQQNSTN